MGEPHLVASDEEDLQTGLPDPPLTEVSQAEPNDALPSDTAANTKAVPATAGAPATKAMPALGLWRPRRVNMARPVEPPVEPPKPRIIKGSVGQGFAHQLGRRATAAKSKPSGSHTSLTGAVQEDVSRPVQIPAEQAEEAAPPGSSPEMVHPVLIKGELRSFTTIGRLRSGPHPLDPETPLWYLRTGEDGPDMPLTHMPTWVKLALQNPPGVQAPAPPSPPHVPRRGADPPSPSSSSPDIEIHRTPKLDQTAAVISTRDPQATAPKASLDPSAPVGGCPSSALPATTEAAEVADTDPDTSVPAEDYMLLADRPACTLSCIAMFTDLPLLDRHSFSILCLRTADACCHVGPALRRRVLSQPSALSLHFRRDPAVPVNLPLLHVQLNVTSSADTIFHLKPSVVPGRVSFFTMDTSMAQFLEDPDSEDLLSASPSRDPQGDTDPANDAAETLTDPPAVGGLPTDLCPLLDKPYRPVDAGTPVHALLALVPPRRTEASAQPLSPIATSSSTMVMEGWAAALAIPTPSSGSHVPFLDRSRQADWNGCAPPASEPGATSQAARNEEHPHAEEYNRCNRKKQRGKSKPTVAPHLSHTPGSSSSMPGPSVVSVVSNASALVAGSTFLEGAHSLTEAARSDDHDDLQSSPQDMDLDLESDYRLEDLLLNLDPPDPERAVSRPSSTRAVAKLLVRSGYRCPMCFSRRDDCRCREGNIHTSCMQGLPRGTQTDFSPVSGCLSLAPTHLDSQSPLHSVSCCLSPQLLPPIMPMRLHSQVISLPASQLRSRLRYLPRPPTVEVAPPIGQGLPHLRYLLCLGSSLFLSHCSPSRLILERTAPDYGPPL